VCGHALNCCLNGWFRNRGKRTRTNFLLLQLNFSAKPTTTARRHRPWTQPNPKEPPKVAYGPTKLFKQTHYNYRSKPNRNTTAPPNGYGPRCCGSIKRALLSWYKTGNSWFAMGQPSPTHRSGHPNAKLGLAHLPCGSLSDRNRGSFLMTAAR
jgi:hypothetical protein